MRNMTACTSRTALWRWGRAVALVVVLGAAVGAQTQSQESPAPPAGGDDQSAIFRSGVTLVTTDVIVRDRDGVFLADLVQDDFTVFEDDQPQELASLVLVHGGRVFNQLLPTPPAQEGIILPPTRAVSDTAGRIFIVFIDDLHIESSKTPRARQVFKQLADNLIHEGDLFGIVTTGPSSIAIDLTYDRNLLYSAMERITGDGFNPTEMIQTLAEGPRGPTELSWRAHVAFKTARDIVRNLETVQNRRKAFIYFSSGYDFNPFAHERVFGRSPGGGLGDGGDLYDGIGDPLMDPFEEISRQGQVFSDADLAMGNLRAYQGGQSRQCVVLHR